MVFSGYDYQAGSPLAVNKKWRKPETERKKRHDY
jgi:hypothetical protein